MKGPLVTDAAIENMKGGEGEVEESGERRILS